MKATLLGATGLIGGHILYDLIQDEDYTSVTLIVRRPFDSPHPKINVKVIDFKDQNAFKSAIEPESIMFCAVGTTRKKVKGDMQKYRQVDYDIPVIAAKLGLERECSTFSLVSAIGANSNSSNFYTKLKGEVEDEVLSLGYPKLHIFRPSILLGNRSEKRLGEKIAQILMPIFSFLLPNKYKPVHAKDVGTAMVRASKITTEGLKVYTYKEIQELV